MGSITYNKDFIHELGAQGVNMLNINPINFLKYETILVCLPLGAYYAHHVLVLARRSLSHILYIFYMCIRCLQPLHVHTAQTVHTSAYIIVFFISHCVNTVFILAYTYLAIYYGYISVLSVHTLQ